MTYPDLTKLESQAAAKLHDTVGIDWIHTQVTDLCWGLLQFLYVSVKHAAMRAAIPQWHFKTYSHTEVQTDCNVKRFVKSYFGSRVSLLV